MLRMTKKERQKHSFALLKWLHSTIIPVISTTEGGKFKSTKLNLALGFKKRFFAMLRMTKKGMTKALRMVESLFITFLFSRNDKKASGNKLVDLKHFN